MSCTFNNSHELKVAIKADCVVQTAIVTTDNTGSLARGNDRVMVAPDGDLFRFTAKPFDNSLGKLDSFTVSFADLKIEVTGVAKDRNSNASASLNGKFSVNGVRFNEYGAFSSGSLAQPLILSFPDIEHRFNVSSTNFVVSINGSRPATKDPAILAAVTGGSPFEILYDASPTIDFTEVNKGFVSATGTISITYQFTPATALHPFSFRRLGRALADLGLRKRK